jgi:copper chaperone CopZ
VELDIKVEGMMCGGCTSRVEAALKAMAGVRAVSVSLEAKLATVELAAPSLMDAVGQLPALVEAVKALGFEAEPDIPI